MFAKCSIIINFIGTEICRKRRHTVISVLDFNFSRLDVCIEKSRPKGGIINIFD
jgi:hypothetical protein